MFFFGKVTEFRGKVCGKRGRDQHIIQPPRARHLERAGGTPDRGARMVELRGFASLPSGSGAQLRTWVSHTVPHLTLMSFTSDAIPGLNNLIALGVSVACAVVIGRALREMSASSRSSPAPAGHRPAGFLRRALTRSQPCLSSLRSLSTLFALSRAVCEATLAAHRVQDRG